MAPPNGLVSEQEPLKVSPTNVGLPRGSRWIAGSAARSHMFLIDSWGQVWGCGNNTMGQVGLPVCGEVSKFTLVPGPWSEAGDRIVQITAGNTFSLFLSDKGQVYAAGSSEAGQLGNGRTGERVLRAGKTSFDIEPPHLVEGALAGREIQRIASGSQHSLAMDKEGYAYGWGYGGYSRLGLGSQKNVLTPTVLPAFAGKPLTRAMAVLCGPASSMVITHQRMVYIAGKWKMTGDGSGGQPYTVFNLVPQMSNIMSASCGGCTYFLTATAPETDKMMTIGWGQGVLYGELGMGPDRGKSQSIPTPIEPLDSIAIFDVAAGPFHTLFLAKPSAELSELPRWPLHIESPDLCVVCDEDSDEKGDPLECEKCDWPYHISCLDPPLPDIPSEAWFCPQCVSEGDAGPEEGGMSIAIAVDPVSDHEHGREEQGMQQQQETVREKSLKRESMPMEVVPKQEP
ncbi:hypothetical protein M231_02201 [Tremella mesenterica]|uniref:PHD-type domain-containing protein n=1 Tax=Tremella mesenterica TaxID=5217 RepID=A0A4Q1BRI0_TREME|nr:hypothetical protein M231_02201 [Tremella mesenterica]